MNEWITNNDSWDITTVGNRIIVKNNKKKKILDIEYNLGNVFIFHVLNIKYKSIVIETLNIRAKRIGKYNCKKQKVIRIINSQGIEISRFGSNSQEYNEINWPNALEVKDDYMNPILSHLNLKNGDFYYQHNSDNPTMNFCNISASTVNVGLASEICDFIDYIKKILSREATKEEINKFKNWYKYLKHVRLIEQLPPGEISKINNLLK